MKCCSAITSGLITAAGMMIGTASAVEAKADPQLVQAAQNSAICVFEKGVPRSSVPAMASDVARQHAGSVRFVYQHAIQGFSLTVSQHAIRSIERNPNIAYCESNGVAQAVEPMPSAKKTVEDVTVEAATVPQGTPWGISRVGGPVSGAGKHAWVIDTGIDLENADLDVAAGANFVRGKPTTHDLNGHGTHIAGIIAALDNEIDSVGVAAGATVHPVRVLDKYGSGLVDWVIAGVDYVAANAQAGDVANMSLTAYGHFQSLHDAVANTAGQGVFFALAAGNSEDYAGLYEPAHVEHPGVFTVSAVDVNDAFAYFSNYGNPPIDFAAPGVNILSNQVGGGVVAYSGTSMAAPHVAGLALLLSGTPNVSGWALADPDGQPDPIAHY